jgi:hypothetical protein
MIGVAKSMTVGSVFSRYRSASVQICGRKRFSSALLGVLCGSRVLVPITAT